MSYKDNVIRVVRVLSVEGDMTIMAKQDDLPGVPPPALPIATTVEELEALKERPAFELGVEHRFFLKRGRRCSLPTKDLEAWTLRDFQAFKKGLE